MAGVIAPAKALGLRTTADGVERETRNWLCCVNLAVTPPRATSSHGRCLRQISTGPMRQEKRLPCDRTEPGHCPMARQRGPVPAHAAFIAGLSRGRERVPERRRRPLHFFRVGPEPSALRPGGDRHGNRPRSTQGCVRAAASSRSRRLLAASRSRTRRIPARFRPSSSRALILRRVSRSCSLYRRVPPTVRPGSVSRAWL